MTQKILNILKVAVFLLPLAGIKAQVTNAPDSLSSYALKKYQLNHNGMIILTSWASANILSGADYFIAKPKHDQYFYHEHSLGRRESRDRSSGTFIKKQTLQFET